MSKRSSPEILIDDIIKSANQIEKPIIVSIRKGAAPPFLLNRNKKSAPEIFRRPLKINICRYPF